MKYKDYKNTWINQLLNFPEHISGNGWWILWGSGLSINHSDRLHIGPRFSENQKHKPYDLRCNCCFICSWLLRLTIYPIVKLIRKV